MIKVIRSFVNDESGATAIEYGLIAALVALVGVVAFTALGDTIVGAFDDIASALCNGTGGNYTVSNAAAGTAGSCT
ncbi:Flp family type IVb pilin [Sneathiella sp.]|uniref:Flp family type IVb pilin n=1 Tax=Sneathiella sp. TaxID=1964365 RepID=UPI003563D053